MYTNQNILSFAVFTGTKNKNVEKMLKIVEKQTFPWIYVEIRPLGRGDKSPERAFCNRFLSQ